MSKIFKFFVATFAIFCSFFSLSAFASNSTIIKVGYSENYGMLSPVMSKGAEGYGYEYLQKIFSYIDGNYRLEFVECSWVNAFDMLRDGSIDLLAPVTYSNERASEFAFSARDFGEESVFITTLLSNDTFYNDFARINNSTIAVQNGFILEQYLLDFLELYNLTPTIEHIDSSFYTKELTQTGYEYCLSTSMHSEAGLKIVANLGAQPVHLIGNDFELMAKIDSAMDSIEDYEYLFKESLYLKYFNHDIVKSEAISQDDYNILQARDEYNMGIAVLNSPSSYIDKDGNLKGVVVDIMNMIALDAEIKINFFPTNEQTSDKEYKSYDFNFLALADDRRFDLSESLPLVQLPFFIVRQNYGSDSNQTLATLDYYGITNEQVSQNIGKIDFFQYPNTASMVVDFNSGKVSSLVVTSVSLNSIREDLNDLSYIATPTETSLNLCITYNDEFPSDKIEAIDKFILRLNSANVEYAVLENSSNFGEHTGSGNAQLIILISSIFSVFVVSLSVLIFNKKIKNFNFEKITEAVDQISSLDDITGLFTEKKFLKEASSVILNNTNEKYSILSIDIDNYKYINDVFGHDIGTKTLKLFSDYLKSDLEPDLPITRTSADNFLVLIQTQALAEKLKHFMKKESVRTFGVTSRLTDDFDFGFSIGSYDIPNSSASLNSSIDFALLAHAKSKEILGISWIAYSNELREQEFGKSEVLTHMTQALANKEFELYFQLKIDLNSLQMTGAEALVRWVKNGEVVSPAEFIPIFEQNGFIEKLDYYVIREACKLVCRNRSRLFPKISVNVSGITLSQDNFVSSLLRITQNAQIKPGEIDIEITESAFVMHDNSTIEKLESLRELGFTISMDDFGTGISALNRLKDIPIDTLKIDREFIVDALENPKGAKIIKNVIQMANDLDLNTVAEGIETSEQLLFLRSMGCVEGQGFYFSKPLPENDFLEILKRHCT